VRYKYFWELEDVGVYEATTWKALGREFWDLTFFIFESRDGIGKMVSDWFMLNMIGVIA